MSNLTAVLNDQIRRLARRESRSDTRTVRRATAQYRRDIAFLKRQVHSLTQRLTYFEKTARQTPMAFTPPAEVLAKGRFRAMGVKAHRRKLGLSAGDYARLVGVSKKTIYQWEGGKAKPRSPLTTAKWLAVRGLGKRQAMERLGLAESRPSVGGAPHTLLPRPERQRGVFQQTAEQVILSLLKGGKMRTTRQINEAWRNRGRRGAADTTLGRMVQAGKLEREKIKGGRGSTYWVSSGNRRIR